MSGESRPAATEAPEAAPIAPVIGAQPGAAKPMTSTPPDTRRSWRTDLLVHLFFLLAALYVMGRLWLDLRHRTLGSNSTDQLFGEWMFADQARTLTHLRNPFFSHGQNVPLGVNLMGNVATQLTSWLMSPVTLLFGAVVTFAVVSTLNLAVTASAWHHVLSRHLVRHRLAAFVGAAFCGFSPGMISESNSHIHIPAQYLVPFLLLAVIRLREPGHAVRRGLALGILVAAQLLNGEEVLFLTAIGCAVMVIAYTVQRPQQARAALVPFASGIAVALGVVLLICAYPLWMQFFGPRHYHGLVATYSSDLTAFLAYPHQSIGGMTSGQSYAPNLAEETAYFGLPLSVGAVGIAVLLWRRSMAARLAAVTGLVAAILSLGPHITWRGCDTGLSGPYRLLADLPVFDSLITLRLALITAVAIGILLALGTDWVLDHLPRAAAPRVPVRTLAGLGGLVLLLPLVPLPLPIGPAFQVPHFITSGAWRRYVREDRTLVPVDAGNFGNVAWAIAAGANFNIPEGYTLVPKDPPSNMVGDFNVPFRPTEQLLYDLTGDPHIVITPADRAQAVVDLRYLRADAVVMQVTRRHTPQLAANISSLLNRQPERVSDVYVWRLRDL